MNTHNEFSAATAASSTAETIDLNSFDLPRCCHVAICELHDLANRKPLPPPEKFVSRSKIQDGKITQCKLNDMAYFKEQSRKSIGAMIAREENAQWPCTKHRTNSGAALNVESDIIDLE